jgi:hypothetical protein
MLRLELTPLEPPILAPRKLDLVHKGIVYELMSPSCNE